jgi:hypothetical protein
VTKRKKTPKKTGGKPAKISLVNKEAATAAANLASPATDELVPGTPSERELAQERAQSCAHDLAQVLEHHRCRIMPLIRPDQVEPVGLDGNKVQITATYYVAPLP